MDVEGAAILVYGYSKEHADTIKECLEKLIEHDVTLIDGSDKEEMTINDILGSGFGASFKEDDVKILMFIGFKGTQIEKCLHFYPRGEIVRPIFCTLTEHNVGWTLEQLKQDLMQEHRAWTKKHDVPVRKRGGEGGLLPDKALEELKEALDTPVDKEFMEEEHPELADVDEDVEPISLEGMMDHEEGIEDIDSIIHDIEEGESSEDKDDEE